MKDDAGSLEQEEASTRFHWWMRWLVLVLSSLLLFGNYYSFDNPAALETQLQQYLQMDDSDYQCTPFGVL